jgi:hypothetical protein
MSAPKYYGRLLMTAFKGTWAFTDSKLTVLIFGVLSLVIGLALHYCFVGYDEFLAKWKEALLSTGPGAVVAFVLVYACG